MWVSKHNELIGSSRESFEDAARQIVARADRTLIVEYLVTMQVIFLLEDPE